MQHPSGATVPATSVGFFPIIAAKTKNRRVTVEAEDAESALGQAKRLFPHFLHSLAVQEQTSYDNPEPNEPVRVFRATKARSH